MSFGHGRPMRASGGANKAQGLAGSRRLSFQAFQRALAPNEGQEMPHVRAVIEARQGPPQRHEQGSSLAARLVLEDGCPIAPARFVEILCRKGSGGFSEEPAVALLARRSRRR